MTSPFRFFLIVFTMVFVWVFADALFRDGLFAYRDSGHFYYPLFQYVRSEWLSGRIPLWNPYENFGVPLAANATSSVFYPGMVVFLLPLPLAWSYKLYVMGHVVLAAGTAYRLGRVWNTSVLAAGVAAISYAFCGNVLFQCCNVVFLVGAAWLPLAVETSERMIRKRSIRATAAFGAVLALMFLGGDPQMAYNAGLMATFYAVLMWWRERGQHHSQKTLESSDRPQDCSSMSTFLRWVCSRPALLAMAATSGLVLAAVQVLPSVEMSQRSDRAATELPRSVYELPRFLGSQEWMSDNGFSQCLDSLISQTTERESHYKGIWDFSVGPWRLAEYLWPNFSGRKFPINRRWIGALSCEQDDRTWVPSMYMGLVPVMLGLFAFRFRRGTTSQVWLSWCTLLAVLASFGAYGVGWLTGLLSQFSEGAAPQLGGSAYGGVYWCFVVFLPGYVMFRYPAKLLVVAALGLSILCAIKWDEIMQGRSRGFCRCLLGLAIISALGALALWFRHDNWSAWLEGVGVTTSYGPLDARRATLDLIWTMLQTAIVAITASLLLWQEKVPRPIVARVLLIVVAIDVGFTNQWLVACAPAKLWNSQPELAVAIRADLARMGDTSFCRVSLPKSMRPSTFAKQRSTDRLAETVAWERETLFLRHNLPAGICTIAAPGTLNLSEQATFESMAAEHAPSFTQYVVLGKDETLPEGQRLAINKSLSGISLWRTAECLPRAWIVHDIEVAPPLVHDEPRAVRARTALALRRDLRSSALVETDDSCVPGLANSREGVSGNETTATPIEYCRIVQYESCRVEIEARLAKPGLVVLSDQYYPGWQLTVESDGQKALSHPILRTNRIMRGAVLPAGKHRLTFRFLPQSVFWGAGVSCLGWFILVIWVAVRSWRRRIVNAAHT